MILLNAEDIRKMPISELKRYRLKMHILRILYAKKTRSASALGKKINVSLPTIRAVLDELIEEKIVRIEGIGDSRGGRKPVMYGLYSDAFYILAVELGHYSAKAVIYNGQNVEVSSVREFDTNINDGELETKVDHVLQVLLEQASLSRDQIVAIGLSMPGLIDAEAGVNKTIVAENQRHVVDRFYSKFHIRTYIENDARMQALGEFTFGKARNSRHTIVINWDWGLGLGMILNGEIYSGSNGSAGELSHIRIQEDGDLCECGKKGCLQSMAGTRKLISMAKEELAKGAVSQLASQFTKDIDNIKAIDVINCAKKGDELCISLLSRLSTRMGWGLSVMIQLFNPELIVLSGPIIKASQYVLIPIQQALHKYCLESILESVRVEVSEMGENSGLKGVGVMVYQKIFSDKSLS
ncbi:ROK family transcriptional regulator [Mangrovibacterium diazotrophicum]|uniref:Putative NBD/HSP70 family sugar kinase n=1 Tax=Mangrovibacterium diazotrophicum TaxID=1261403 RepID=A0A419W9E5_9BACT|nr:ROK family transcriptional regulator [Mangrovibacterium diazotrophicum]RKD92022.1 putative NBD/HSP70 family sugar kinase [Mangrovibacterium diazotrophicum]